MPTVTYACEKCQSAFSSVMGVGQMIRFVKLAGDLDALLCASCQRIFDHMAETHPDLRAYLHARDMVPYWFAQAHWRDVQTAYVQALRHAVETRHQWLQVVYAWLSETVQETRHPPTTKVVGLMETGCRPVSIERKWETRQGSS